MTLFCKEIIRLVVLIALNSQTMTTGPILKKKTVWIMLDPVVEYTAHAQWAEYMLQAIQLDGRMKP